MVNCMEKKLSWCLFTVFTLFWLMIFSSTVYADKGIIPILPGVSVYEPGQKAIIAWNGEEEVLILSTDVFSNGETLVIELLPLPSEPKVELASFDSFRKIQSLIWKENMKLSLAIEGGDHTPQTDVEIIFHEKLGAHNITVVRAENYIELVNWIENFLQANDVNESFSLGDFEQVIEDYISKGFHYYVLDLITVNSEEKSVNPILYRFKSGFLYYPLVITSPLQSETNITLFLLTNGAIVSDCYPMEKATYRIGNIMESIDFPVQKEDLYKIDIRIGELFDEGAWLTVLKYEGNVKWLKQDLIIAESSLAAESEDTESLSIEVVLPPAFIGLFILLGLACGLVGMTCGVLLTRSQKESKKSIDINC